MLQATAAIHVHIVSGWYAYSLLELENEWSLDKHVRMC